MFNPPILRDAYALAKLAEDILTCPKPIMVHDDTRLGSVDPVVECEDLSLNYISTNDVMLVDPIVECEDIPLTYLSTYGVELLDPIEEYEAINEYDALPPPYIHIDDVAFKCSNPLE